MSNALRARRAPSPAPRRRRAAAVLSVVCVLVVGAIVLSTLLRPHHHSAASPPSLTPLPVGSMAPRVELADAGDSGASLEVPAAGEATLVSFLATAPDTANTPSRSQAVELVSLASQYAPKGLRVVIVDDSSMAVTEGALENTRYDWQLGSIPLLADPDHTAADRYDAASAPTTLLIGRGGRVLDRWSGYVLTAVAAQAISAALAEGPTA